MTRAKGGFIMATEIVARSRGSYAAFQILRFVFTVLPIVAGVTKFFNGPINWEQYLSPDFNLLGNAHNTMMVVGVVEIIAGILVWIKPKVFSYLVALWLLLIVVNLGMLHHFYDIMLRDIALLLSALALGAVAYQYD